MQNLTELLVLLLYHAEMDAKELFFRPEPHQRDMTVRKLWDIKKTKTVLGCNVTTSMLFLHALLGCDNTSRVHGIGKGIALKKAKINEQFRQLAGVFNRSDSSREDVIEAGEKALLSVFNAASTESLNSLRYTKYCQKVATGNVCLQPENLPSTSSEYTCKSRNGNRISCGHRTGVGGFPMGASFPFSPIAHRHTSHCWK